MVGPLPADAVLFPLEQFLERVDELLCRHLPALLFMVVGFLTSADGSFNAITRLSVPSWVTCQAVSASSASSSSWVTMINWTCSDRAISDSICPACCNLSPAPRNLNGSSRMKVFLDLGACIDQRMMRSEKERRSTIEPPISARGWNSSPFYTPRISVSILPRFRSEESLTWYGRSTTEWP